MTAPFLPTAASTTQFDLPPIASTSQWVQQATPFSQLFNQAQAAVAPAPVPAPPPPPPSPPPPPATFDSTTDGEGNGNSQAGESASAAPPLPPANDDNSDPATGATPTSNQTPNQAMPNAVQSSHDKSTAPSPAAHGSDQGAQAKTKGGTADAQQPKNGDPTVTTATTTAQVTQIEHVAKHNDGKKGEDEASSDGSKSDNTAQSNDASTPTTPDLSAQAVAGAVAALPVGETTAKPLGKTKDDTSVTAVESASKALGQTAVSNLGKQPAQSTAAAGPTTGGSTNLTPKPSAAVGKAELNAKAGDAFGAAANQATKPVNGTSPAAQADVSAVSTAAEPQLAPVVTTLAASEPAAVSTITVDATASAISTTPGIIDNPPSPASGISSNEMPPNNAPSPSTFAANLSQNATPAAPSAGGPAAVDRARFVQRVARAFQVAGEEGGQMRLRLSPPELGSLQMQISVKQGGLSATIQADNSTAQQVLLASLPDLRDRLAEQGIRLDQFDVQVAGQGSGGMPQPQDNPDFNQPAPKANLGTTAAVSTSSTDPGPAVSGSPLSATGALNVIV